MTPLLVRLAEKLADIFDDREVPYAFGGALANNVWGIVRATQDVDCLVAVPALKFQQFDDGLNDAGCVIRMDKAEHPVTVEALRNQIDERNLMEVYWSELRAELFVPIVSLQNEILQRAVFVQLDRRAVRLTTAEDLIVLKMVFRRAKESMTFAAYSTRSTASSIWIISRPGRRKRWTIALVLCQPSIDG